MIDKYEIKKENNEEVLYVYISLDYDFSLNEFNDKIKDIKTYIKEFIKKNEISFRGNVVNIMIGGFLISSILLNNNFKSNNYTIDKDIKLVGSEVMKKTTSNEAIVKAKELNKAKEDNTKKTVVKSNTTNTNKTTTKKSTKTTSTKKSITTKKSTTTTTSKAKVDNNIYINLKRNGKVQKIELEEYIIGVVGAEMPAAFNIEALKAQAIISRTYALKARSKGKTLSDNESTQSYQSNDQLKAKWGSNYNTYYNKIKKAVNETKGMYLTYKGNYIEAVFHSTSNGKTEASVNVWGNTYPYLVSVESKYDNLNSSFQKDKKITYSELSKKLGFTVSSETEFNILGKTSGNRVSKISVGSNTYTGVKLRNILGLRSADFTIKKIDDGVIFTTKGYGHGVGLSQYGANGYAKNGYSYQKILLHYYPGVSLKKYSVNK